MIQFTGPVESKVKSATMSAALAGLATWAVEAYVFKGKMPPQLKAVVDLGVPAVFAFVGGFLAKHTDRPDLEEEPPRRRLQ